MPGLSWSGDLTLDGFSCTEAPHRTWIASMKALFTPLGLANSTRADLCFEPLGKLSLVRVCCQRRRGAAAHNSMSVISGQEVYRSFLRTSRGTFFSCIVRLALSSSRSCEALAR